MDFKNSIIDLYSSVVNINKDVLKHAEIDKNNWQKQHKVNSFYLMTILAGLGLIVIVNEQFKLQNSKINSLSKEIKELKIMKGE